jgi:hypothetical protein
MADHEAGADAKEWKTNLLEPESHNTTLLAHIASLMPVTSLPDKHH